MPVPTDITAGTLTITNGSTAVTGLGTSWLASDLRQGDIILWIEGGDGFQTPILASVESNTALTLVEPWEGPTLTNVRYRIRYQWDSSRVSAQSRQLIEMLDNGNVLALTGLTGPGVPVFDGPHSMVVRPESDFINGVAYNVQVDTLADRDAYDGQAVGFAVLVSDVGDGRSAVYSKASNASGDWTDPAYVTGPVGPASTVPGVVWRGTYNPATTYATNDGVLYNGSSWRAKISTTGNAPPNLPTAENTQWLLLARAGTDGTGTGDVVGPASSTAGRYARYANTTGKLLQDGPNGIPNADLASMVQATLKGRASSSGTGTPIDLSAAEALAILATGGNYQRSNILGTVSQSAGVPTGAIIERGSNANGEYVRFADGTQICWKQVPQTQTVNAGEVGAFTWTYPSTFINSGTLDVQINVAGTSPASATAFRWGTGTPSTSSVTFYMFNDTAANAQAYPTISARGRWF